MKKFKKFISLSLLSFSLLTLPQVRVQATTLPKLDITDKNYKVVYAAKQFKNRSMILGLKNGWAYFGFARDNFEYKLTEGSMALLVPRVIGENANNVYVKDIGFNNEAYFHLDKTNPNGDCELIKDEIINNYKNMVNKNYINADIQKIYPLGDEIEWVEFSGTTNGKNTTILVNKNGTIVDTNNLGLEDSSGGYFNIRAVDSNGNLLTSKKINEDEYVIKINTDGSLQKFNLNKDLIIGNNVKLKPDTVIAYLDDMIEDNQHNLVAFVNERDKDYKNYTRDVGIFKIEGSKITLVKKLNSNFEDLVVINNRFIMDNNNDVWIVTGGKTENYLSKLASSYNFETKYALDREISHVDVYDENNIIVSSSRGFGGVKRQASPVIVDELYKSAYDSTMNALNKKNQESINKSRKDISQLIWVNYSFVGEFSKQVDEVQQGLFQNFMGVLFDKNGHQKAYSTVSQDELNTGRKLVNSFATYSGNRPYITSWSSAIDEFQQYKISLANNLVETAEKLKTNESKGKATEGVNELLKVQENNKVLNFAKALEKRVNLIEVTN